VASGKNNLQKPDKNSESSSPKALVGSEIKDAKTGKISTRIICSSSINCKKDSDEKWVALTFDDGPSPDYTLQILALLKQYNIHATFCLIGRQVKKYPEIVEQIVADGHKIALHSMNHDENLSRRSDKKIKSEILGEKELLETIVPDAKIDYYRAPGGNWNLHVRKMITSWGLKPLGWSVDTKDWARPGVDSIIENVNNELHPGGVVLMHDAGGNRNQTVVALKQLLPTLKAEGYQFGFPN
jgi:peptidoglycan/xylan/chitin deacetylase (PgdA/CDA1 family)